MKELVVVGDLNFMGFLFEALVERDLRVYADSFGAQIMHYQDYTNRELDAVIEMENGDWAAVEIKLGAAQEDAAAANLIAIRNTIAKEPKGRPPKSLIVVLGRSAAAYTRPDGVHVVPISALINSFTQFQAIPAHHSRKPCAVNGQKVRSKTSSAAYLFALAYRRRFGACGAVLNVASMPLLPLPMLLVANLPRRPYWKLPM